MPRGWAISPVIGTGTDEDPYRPSLADRPSVDGDRLEFVIDRERSSTAIVAFDVADPSNFADHGGEIVAFEGELDEPA
jgi:hypothetical protein